MTSPADVSTLKAEVAELWRRFKHDGPAVHVEADSMREALLETTRTLEQRHQALLARRDELERTRRLALSRTRARRLGFGVLGLLCGGVLGLSGAAEGLEAVAVATVDLPALVGGLLLSASVPAVLLLRAE